MRDGILLDHAPYTPFMQTRTAHPPGLSPLEPADWFPVDPDFAAQMAYREVLLRDVPGTVLASVPEAVAPVAEVTGELLAEVTAHLARDARYRVAGDRITRPDGQIVHADPAAPLDSLARLVASDFCLLTPDIQSDGDGGGGEYRLIAATLCFPSRWSLAEKLGHPLIHIHRSVPDYDDVLARRVGRMFAAIRVGRPLVRVNWLVHPSAELHLPLGTDEKGMAEGPALDGPFYLRTERQTLTRLPVTGAVVFGIKTSLCPLEVLRPDEAAALLRELSVLEADVIAYRAGADLHKAVLSRLEELAPC